MCLELVDTAVPFAAEVAVEGFSGFSCRFGLVFLLALKRNLSSYTWIFKEKKYNEEGQIWHMLDVRIMIEEGTMQALEIYGYHK